MANFLGALEALFDRSSHFNAESLGHRLGFSHDRGRELAGLCTLHDFNQSSASERADRIVGHVAHQLDPHVMPNVCANRTAQSSFDESIGNLSATLALRSVGLANGEARPLDMLDNPRLANVRRRIDYAANDSRRIDVFGNLSTGIDRFKLRSFPLAAVTIEVPPGNTVLRTQDAGFRRNNRRQTWSHRRQAVRFQG